MASLPIACALTPADFKARLADLSSLTRDALISGWRDDLTLHLRYKPEEEGRVRRMVEHEQECCAFLTFDLRSAPDAIELWITAPEAARAVIEPIYVQFVEADGSEESVGSSPLLEVGCILDRCANERLRNDLQTGPNPSI